MQQVRSTHERELTSAVDLTTPDGRRLNPDAVGWSRQTLHRCALRGSWGRNKRWDYWCVLAGDLVVSCVYADVDYLGLSDVWWCDLRDGRTGGAGVVAPVGRGFELPDVPGTAPLRVERGGYSLTIADDADGTTRIDGAWREPDGRPGRVSLAVALPEGHESLNVVIPWSERRFQFTSKHQARPATGTLTVGDEVREIDGGWGVLDVGRGRWPYRTTWNWGGGAGRAAGGEVVGLQLGGRWTEGTGATENGVLVDGRLTKLGRELVWRYDWDDPLKPWTVSDPGGRLDLTLTPRHDKHTRTEALVLGTETHQVFGTWSGRFDDLTFDGLQGFAEESRSRW